MTKPYGANEATTKWAKVTGSRYAPRGRCLHWVAGVKCPNPVGLCDYAHRRYDWMDHVTGWTQDGKRVLLSQPYGITEFSSLAKACKELGLKAFLHGRGWYGHGSVCIEFSALEKITK